MSTDTFHTKIRAAIADKNLQAALDKNAAIRYEGRATAYDNLGEDLQILRQRAHAVRAKVIANHTAYLDQFQARAEANGFIIHRAHDAAQAQEIVLKIANRHNAKLIAKSKTMVSEEIGLNHTLESAGITPVETDLGEYIVQLRGEPPSHIITPAVHLRREDVGETFQAKLDLPYTTDIQVMTDVARAALRETFLNADIGVSGVNFGVAEGGAISLVTNEGNGRMVTTLPKVHIALMGIERLVPTYEDLAMMLTLLPRAATAQKISVYTQIIQGPRADSEVDGAVERHIVLVDNGRSAVRGTTLNDTLFCIRCGACLNACPVFREIGGYSYASVDNEYTPYPGPIGSALSPALFGQDRFGHLAQASTLCGACKEACPMDIDLPTMLLRVRGGLVGESTGKNNTQTPRHPEGVGVPDTVKWGLRLFTWFAATPNRFSFAQKAAAAFSRIWSPRAAWMRLPASTGWGFSKDFPRPAGKTFREQWKTMSSEPSQAVQPPQEPPPIQNNTSGSSARGDSQKPLNIQFKEELESLGGSFVECAASELPAAISQLLASENQDQVMAWGDEHLPDGLRSALEAGGITVQHKPDPAIKVGITGALAGIANTGTLVVTSGKGKPGSISLLPQIHIAILRRASLCQTLTDALSLQALQNAPSVSLISGPSKTADIEQTLTIGVHGPGQVHVYCI